MAAARFVVFLLAMTSMGKIVADTDIEASDLFSRVSSLEDRLFALLLVRNPTVGQDSSKAVEDLTSRVETLESFRDARELSSTCERGMGDDVSKQYRPYTILSDSTVGQDVLCDTHTDGGGWIIIQRRSTGDVNFNRPWAAYREGFGSITSDFWLGNEALQKLTSQHSYEVRIDIRLDGEELFAYSSSFSVGPETDSYRLQLGACSGTVAAKALCYHNGMAFSTVDRDNDKHVKGNCASTYLAGWWYNACHNCHINGNWGLKSTKGVSWLVDGAWRYPNFTEMKIRRVGV